MAIKAQPKQSKMRRMLKACEVKASILIMKSKTTKPIVGTKNNMKSNK